MRLVVAGWAAWAPDLETPEAWRAWAERPTPLAEEGTPNARFLPPMLRRRCTPLSKMMLRVAFDCATEDLRADVRTVFSSRHGSINESLDLLRCVVDDAPLSPARFSHTVHNAQAGLFSIAAGNRCASASIADRDGTMAAGFLEAMGHLEREPETPVLLVAGDAPLDPTFAPLVPGPQVPHALALRLTTGGEGTEISFALGEARDRGALPWPDAVEWLRFFLSPDASVSIPGARCGYTWRKETSTP